MTYQGMIVEESLIDNLILNDLTIKSLRISDNPDPEERWHIYTVEIDENQITKLSSQLKPTGWYVHFWHDNTMKIVFPNKLFTVSRSNPTTWQDTIVYGQSIGIPLEQLDFKTDETI